MRNLIFISFLLPLFLSVQANNGTGEGSAHFKVFWNYNYDFSDSAQQVSAFSLMIPQNLVQYVQE